MDFEKICMMFTMQEPFYGVILSSMERVADARVTPTMGVCRTGNVFRLAYNPEFIEKLTVDQTLEILKHEVLHIAFGHFTMWENMNVPNEVHQLRNIAEDMEINGYLNKDIVRAIGGVLAEQISMEDKLGTKTYYDELQKIQNKMQELLAQHPELECNGGQGDDDVSKLLGKFKEAMDKYIEKVLKGKLEKLGKAKLLDDHSLWPKDLSASDIESIATAVDELVAFAAEETEKNRGTIPAEMAGKVDILRKKPRPVADWKRYFRRYLGNEFTDLLKKSKKRESKRFPDAAGTRHRKKSHILVAIDTSGSVSMPEYREFMGQIKTLSQSCTFHVVECDARIQHEYDFKYNIPEVLHGGGGTDFQPVVDLFWKEKRKYEGLVYFTDGGAPIPKNTPRECLWVISSQGDKNRKKYLVNGASVVFIPQKTK